MSYYMLLIVLVLCWLVARPGAGLPARPSGPSQPAPPPPSAPERDLQPSASGDGLISGSDFLSLFIGASLPRSGRARAHDDPEQNKVGAWGARLIPKPKGKAPPAHPANHPARFRDISDAKSPSVEVVSFDTNKSDLPDAATHIVHSPDRGMEFRSESLHSSSGTDDSIRTVTSEYYSNTPTEDNAPTTPLDNLSDSPSTPFAEQTSSPYVKQDVTIITEVVTSREELLSETATAGPTSEEHEAQASIQYHRAVVKDNGPKESPVKAPAEEEPVPTTPTPLTGDAADAPPPPEPVQVVSVRVSSSVKQGPSASPFLAREPSKHIVEENHLSDEKSDEEEAKYSDGLVQTPPAPASDEEIQQQIETETAAPVEEEGKEEEEQEALPVATLVTEHQHPAPPPAVIVTEHHRPAPPTSVQRSELSVEEAAPSSSEISPPHHGQQPTAYHRTVARVVEVSRNSQSSPVSYHTSVSSASGGSSMHFYREPPGYQRREGPSAVAESVRTTVVTSHQHPHAAAPKFERLGGGPVSQDGLPIEGSMGRYGTQHHEVRIVSQQPSHRVSFTAEVHPARESKSFERSGQRPEMVHSQPEKNYGQPERNYGQPERMYSQPERMYSQPEQVYSKPEQVYSKPEQVYSKPEQVYSQPERTYSVPEQNYEVDEAVSVMTSGRAHGVRPTPASQPPAPTVPATPTPPDARALRYGPAVESALGVLDAAQSRDKKFGYVVEGRNFRKYRVEERTPDGFIVGEYGVVSHDDGSLRGVRYTADSTINPRLIYDALVKFLSL